MMLRIFLCDDERFIYETVAEMVAEYERGNDCSCELTYFPSGEELAGCGQTCDILLLDIEMPGMDGIETARRLIEGGAECKIIMLTSNIARFKEAFKIGAMRYVTKPIETRELFEALDEARNRLIGRRELTVTDNGVSYKIMEKGIIYLMADRNRTVLYTKHNDFRSSSSLRVWCAELDSRIFFHCHRSYLVNMEYVEHIMEKEVLLTTGDVLRVSRRRHQEFMQQFILYETTYR